MRESLTAHQQRQENYSTHEAVFLDELMSWLSCRSPGHQESDDLHDYDEEEPLSFQEAGIKQDLLRRSTQV